MEKLNMNQPCKNPLCDCAHLAPVNSMASPHIIYWCPRCGTLTNSAFENGCLIPIDIEAEIEKSAAGTFSDTE